MSGPMISVIIPCYNSYKYMRRCLSSLEKQQYKNFEVIVVDDCSTDDSFRELKAYAENSKLDMTVVSNEKNKGPGYSRNVGISMARGRWLSFCDADDWYSGDRLRKISEVSPDTDCILCNYTSVYPSGKKKKRDYISAIKNTADKNDITAAFTAMSFCLCIINAEIAKKNPVAEMYNGEDYATLPLWIQNSKKIEFMEESMYYYYARVDSASKNPSKKAYLGLCTAFERVRTHSRSEYAPSTEFLGIHYVLYGAVMAAIKADVDTESIRETVTSFEKSCPRWYENTYIKSLPRYKRIFLDAVRKKRFAVVRAMVYIHTALLKVM